MTSDFRADLMAGKVIVVTGGASGIGLGICTAAGLHGAKVVIGSRRVEVVQEACEQLRAQGVDASGWQCDVRKPEDCANLAAKAAEKYGGVDVLVNNAAGNFSVPAEQLSSNGFKTIMDIDLHGSFNMVKAALPFLKKSPAGVIISISATLHYKAFPFQMAASSAKAAIDSMTQNLAQELGVDYGIRVVGIAPGAVENTVGGPGGRVFGALMKQSGNRDPRMLSPLGRYATVQDIGNCVLFLCSDAGSYITGTNVVVDGGQWHGVSGQYLMAKKAIANASASEKTSHKGGVAKL